MHLSAYIDMEKGNGAAVVMAALFLCLRDRESGLSAEKAQISACQIRAKILSPNGYVLFTVHIYAAVAAEVILIIVCVILNRIVDQDYKTL